MAFSKDAGTRKLAAVMFTDIKGFSKKMAQNETAAFELLRTHDALMRVIASKFEGKVVKSIGDSFMVDFASAVNAVKAAVDAQKRFWTFNRGKSEFDKIEVRMGIHLGDVMISGDDMYGDGVNIASRIEAITEPSRICISADIYNQVKNKMDVKVSRMGEMQLKNIPDPVEVYEILIDSIPELATPSKTAQQALNQKPVEDAAASEADEANSVEAAKKRGSTPVPQVQDTASQVESLYKKAEKLYNEGKIGESERIIDEIAKIDPSYHAAVERKKEEEDKERQVHEHYEQAGTYLREGKFDLAEQEVRKIFQMYPLHVGAQQLQLQIEEERYRKTEEERQQRLDQERKVREEKDQQVDEFTKKIEEHIEKEELSEARELLQKIYALDPNFTAGERIEEKLRRADAAKLERERQQAYLEEEKKREDLIAQNQERQLEREQKRVQHQHEQVAPPKFNATPILWTSAIVILVIVAYLVYPQVKRTLFPVSASIAFLPLNDSQSNQGEDPLRLVVPTFLAQDLAHVERVQVVMPTRTSLRGADYQKIAGELQVRYVLHGTVARTDQGFSLNLRLFDAEQDADLFSEKFDGDFLVLNRTRQSIVKAILEATKMEGGPPSIPDLVTNSLAYAKYLNGLSLLSSWSLPNLEQANRDFEESAALDSTFGSAYAGMAEVRIAQYMSEARPEDNLLREAFDLSQKALRLNPNDPFSYRDLATIYFMRHQFDKVSANVEKSLDFQPEDARSYGILSQLAVVQGDYDLALQNALQAVKIMPDDPSLKIVLGIAEQFKGSYPDAIDAFKQAITLGFPDSLVTARYLLNAWSAQEDYSAPIQYYQKSLQDYPNDYRIYYWISRAFQMKPSINDFKEWSGKGRAILSDHLDKNPGDAIARAYLALFLSREGKADDGEAEMNRAVSLAPNSTEILFRQADMYAIQKKNSLAVASLRAALDRNFSFAEILSPDFALLKSDTAFTSVVIRKTDAK
jgi:class 3 adenylate cyclase/TolB-like protein/predicted Zn-dependent protease